MGDPAGDVRPGGASLIGELVGDVVEGENEAILIADPLYGQSALTVLGRDEDIGLALFTAEEFFEFAR